jgi:hypothetical protein
VGGVDGTVKTILVYMMVGAILGAVAASFIVPPVLAWYNEPGHISPNKPVETLCNLPDLIRYTSTRLLWGQLIGAGIGALVFLFPGVFVARRRRESTAVATV